MSVKLSVCMIAYNHAPYIAQAIKGVLAQQTNFDYHIFIGEDGSTDNTFEIIEQFKNDYPDKITLLHQPTNIGMMRNFLSVLDACDGDYVAICEGDDFWIDNFKLQKQVDFLESNSDYAICFHRVYEQIGLEKVISLDNPWESEVTFAIEDLALKNFMHTNSVVFRNKLFKSYPEWYIKSPIGDFVLHLLNAQHGLIKYLPDIMGVYRRFTGTWSSQSAAIQIKKVVQVLDWLITENFQLSVIVNFKTHRNSLLNAYFKLFLDANDYSFLPEMDNLLKDESSFTRQWMLEFYPNKIKQILDSKSYKFAKFLQKGVNIFSKK